MIVPLSTGGALDPTTPGNRQRDRRRGRLLLFGHLGLLRPVAPARICDTRASNTTQCHGKTLSAGGTLNVQVTGNGGVPAGAAAVVANVTATGGSAQSYLTVYPADAASRPLASDLNFTSGETVPNLCVAKLSATVRARHLQRGGLGDALVDVAGWYTS